MKYCAFFCIFLLLFPLSGCLTNEQDQQAQLRLGTTTSMRDSGLLDVLAAEFEAIYGLQIEYVAVGTGAALKLGENKDVDALIVHAPQQELDFIAAGFAPNRTQIAWNAFVLLSSEPLGQNLVETFATIATNQTCFVSRGDNSGTHGKEQELWKLAQEQYNITLVEDSSGWHPVGNWYYSIGQGMGATIMMAHEKDCVTLSDRGTALQFQSKIELKRYEYSDPLLFNPYSFLSVEGPNEVGAQLFLHYLLNEGKSTIANYTINGEPAFFVS